MTLNLAFFIPTAFALAVTPGAGTVYVVARTLRGGWREGLDTVGGTTCGALVHVLAAALGGAALVGRDPARLQILSVAGAGYMAVLGWRTLFAHDAAASPGPASKRGAFRDGLAVAILNPTTAVFLLAFLPQFIDPRQPPLAQLLVLGLLTVACNASAHLAWVAIGARLGAVAQRRAGAPVAVRRMGGVLLLAVALLAAMRALG